LEFPFVVTFSLSATVFAAAPDATLVVLLATPFVVGTFGDLLSVVRVAVVDVSVFRVGVTFEAAVNEVRADGLLAVEIAGFAGDAFVTLVFVTLGLSNVAVVFGLLNVVERRVDVAGADLTRDAVDETVEVFVAVSFDAAVVVLVAGFTKGLALNGTRGAAAAPGAFETVVFVAVVVAVRAVAGFGAVVDVRAVPTADFVTVLLVVVVFFVTVDETPVPLLSGLRAAVVVVVVVFFSAVEVTLGASVRDATLGAAVFDAATVLGLAATFDAVVDVVVVFLIGAALPLTSGFFVSVGLAFDADLAAPTAAAAATAVVAIAAAEAKAAS